MAHEDHSASLRRDDLFGDGNVVAERYSGILDDADGVSVLLQDVVDALPTGTVHKSAVN